MTTPVAPTDEEVIKALSILREESPDLGRAKVLSRLKSENNWFLSDARLKKIMVENALESGLTKQRKEEEEEDLPPPLVEDLSDLPAPVLPENALEAQQKYKDENTRCFKLYGRGTYDYGATPNSDMALLIQMCHKRLTDFGRPTPEQKASMGSSMPVRRIWEFYEAAAQKAGLPISDIGRQFEAEYGVNPLHYLPPPEPDLATRAFQLAHRRAKFKEAKMDMMRVVAKKNPGLIPLDERGEPIYNEAKNGEFALIVAKIDKETGLECGVV